MAIDYSFNGVTLPFVQSVSAPFSSRVASADTPGRPGGYPGNAYAAERKVSLTGTLQNNVSCDALETAWSDLLASHDVFAPAKLVIRSGWFLYALCESLTDSERGIDHISYDATYTCSCPFQYSETLSAPALTAGGGTFAVGGNRPALPTLTVNVSAAPVGGLVTVTNTTTGKAFTLAPDVVGSYVIDSRLETVALSTTVDKMKCFDGEFLQLAPGNNTLTISTASGAAVSSATINYRARSL